MTLSYLTFSKPSTVLPFFVTLSPNSNRSNSPHYTMSLLGCPNEVQYLIINNLDPAALLALGATNRFYYQIARLDCLPFDTVSRFLWDRETRADNRSLDRYVYYELACYRCLCLKPILQFAHDRATGADGTLQNTYDPTKLTRQCLACDLEGGLVEGGKVYKTWGCHMAFICSGCQTIDKLFCPARIPCGVCARSFCICPKCGRCRICG